MDGTGQGRLACGRRGFGRTDDGKRGRGERTKKARQTAAPFGGAVRPRCCTLPLAEQVVVAAAEEVEAAVARLARVDPRLRLEIEYRFHGRIISIQPSAWQAVVGPLPRERAEGVVQEPRGMGVALARARRADDDDDRAPAAAPNYETVLGITAQRGASAA